MNPTILLAGQNPILKISLKFQLQHHYSIVDVSNADKALEVLRAKDQELHLALLDANLSGLSGEELSLEIRNLPHRRQMGVIIATANKLPDEEVAKRLLNSQANHYVCLPLKTALLMALVKNSIGYAQSFSVPQPPTPQHNTQQDEILRHLGMFEFLPLPMMVTDTQGNLLQFNRQMLKLFKFMEPISFNQINLFNFFDQINSHQPAQQLKQVLSGQSNLERCNNVIFQHENLEHPMVFNGFISPYKLDEQLVGAMILLDENTAKFEAVTRLKEEYREVHRLMNLANMLVEARNFNQVTDRIFAEIRQLYPFESINVLLEERELEQLVSYRLILPETLKLSQEDKDELISLKYSSRIMELFRKKHLSHLYTPEVDPSRYNDERFKRAYDLAPIKTNLVFPLGHQDNYFGVLMCCTYNKVLSLSDADIAMIQRFINHLAIALKNARLYDEVLTEKDRANRTLKDLTEAKRFTDSIFDTAPVGIFTLNQKGILTSINPVMRKIFDCDESQLRVGQQYIKEVASQVPEELQLFNDAIAGKTGHLHNFNYTFPKNGKQVVLEMTSTPLYRYDTIQGTLNVYQDVTLKALAEKEVERVNLLLQKEIQDTANVQQLLLPNFQPVNPAFDIHGSVVPAEHCSGDWWSYIDYHEEGILVAVGDVTGHGVPSAMLTAVTDGVFTSFRLQNRQATPDQLLNELNAVIHSCVGGGYNMTMWLGFFDLRRNVLSYANAGHNFPFYLQNGKKIKELPSHGSILGRQATPQTPWELKESPFQSGDWFFIYTDGILENENQQQEEYGKRRMRRLLTRAPTHPDAKTCWNALMDDVKQFVGRQSYDDDMTLVVFKVN